MKNLFIRIFILVVALQLGACNKIIDTYFPDRPGYHQQPECRILTMKLTTYPGMVPQTCRFYYTISGRPMNIAFDNLELIPPYDEGPRHHFEYDTYNRLQTYTITTFANEGSRHGYSYANGLIIFDTTDVTDYNGQTKTISTLIYDDQKRVIKEDIEVVERNYEPASGFSTITYAYDSNGNLIKEGVQYDDKKSFLRTDNIWMFINRNYSRNNPSTAKGYNNYGYPVGFTGPEPGFIGADGPLEITYECE